MSLPGLSPAPRVPLHDETSSPSPRGRYPHRAKAAIATLWHWATSPPQGSTSRSTPSPHVCSPPAAPTAPHFLMTPIITHDAIPHTPLLPGVAWSEDKHGETRVLTSGWRKPLPLQALPNRALLIVIEN